MAFDIWRQQKCPGALCSNDAKSCYDRIAHSALSLALQRIGMPRGPIESMLTSTQQLKHCVHTAYGDSDQCLNSTTLWELIHGVGQDNGAGPTVWALLSSPILNILRKRGFGAKFRSAFAKELLHIAGHAYVDDTDIAKMARDCVQDFSAVVENL